MSNFYHSTLLHVARLLAYCVRLSVYLSVTSRCAVLLKRQTY